MDFLLQILQGTYVRSVLTDILLPPSLNIWLGLLGLIVARWYPKVGKSVIFVSILFLYVLSTTFGEVILGPTEETARPLDVAQLSRSINEADSSKDTPQAIVVLAGGRYRRSPEYGERGTISDHTLIRVRYAAYLYKETNLPILVSGWGNFLKKKPGEAQIMADALTKEFSVPVKWLEGNSRTTAENALYSGKMLRPLSVNNIVLVTEVAHMARAKEAFLRNGFEVTAAPTGYGGGMYRGHPGSLPILKRITPNAKIFQRNSFYLHEWLGVLWYRMAELWKKLRGNDA